MNRASSRYDLIDCSRSLKTCSTLLVSCGFLEIDWDSSNLQHYTGTSENNKETGMNDDTGAAFSPTAAASSSESGANVSAPY
jgi:hypothetical protein